MTDETVRQLGAVGLAVAGPRPGRCCAHNGRPRGGDVTA